MFEYLFAFYIISALVCFIMGVYDALGGIFDRDYIEVGHIVIPLVVCLLVALIPLLNTAIGLRLLLSDVLAPIMKIRIKGEKKEEW